MERASDIASSRDHAAAQMPATDTLGSRETAEFVTKANTFHLYQIEASQLVLERSTSELVTGAAEMMIEDHKRSLSELRNIAAADDLSRAAPSEIDRCYVQHGDEPMITDLAEKCLPRLRRHLHYFQTMANYGK